MDAEAMWQFFLKTGLPEAYSLYQSLARTEEAEREAQEQPA